MDPPDKKDPSLKQRLQYLLIKKWQAALKSQEADELLNKIRDIAKIEFTQFN